MANTAFSGIYPPAITPFTESGSIDFKAIDRNIDKWNETGLSGYVVFGSNGESVHLTSTEKISILKRFVDRSDGKQVIAGTGLQATHETIEFTKSCADAGSTAALVINPSFYGLSHDVLADHYLRIADASPVPVLIYNVPKFTGANIDAEVVVSLAEHPNIAGIKDSSGDVTQMSRIISLAPNDFAVLSGTINVLHPACTMGAAGAVTALANLAPDLCIELYHLSTSGNSPDARRLQQKLIPPNVAVTKTYGIPGLKAAMELVGYSGGWPRLPLKPVPKPKRQEIKAILQSAGIL